MNSFPYLFHKTRVFLEMIKFEHSIFALPFAYLGLILAEGGWPRGPIFFWVTVAMVSFRTMGMSLNRLIDRSIDARNPRTANRALPAGTLKSSFVWGITLTAWLLFEWSAYQLNPLCFKLSWIPVALAFLYPWMKRFTWLSHFVLGTILGIAPYGAWLASQGMFAWTPALLAVGVTAWVAGFDIIYAFQDFEFDRQSHLYSLPARFGIPLSLKVTQILHGVAVVAWFSAGMMVQMGWIYLGGLVFVAFCLIRESRLMAAHGLNKIQEAFFQMNVLVSLSLFLAVVCDVWVRRFFS